ncbi:MAG: CDP-glycerol glycerophosphotransferase family protein [Burkholderiales bacterium]|nr:CDP-glycerol glycerophosphotransferase family protein [Burkholderiales bacterium]
MTDELIGVKCAFVGWNPFQLQLVEPILMRLPNAVFLLEPKKGGFEYFDEALLNRLGSRIVRLRKYELLDFDGQFDVLVCQSPFAQIHEFKKTRIVMLQYGYAKEPHNYGAWRAFADLNLVYGEYAAQRIARFSPVVAVGHPVFDVWLSSDFHQSVRARFASVLLPHRKTVLYAPTWGDLSSLPMFFSAVEGLASGFNVLIKIHHNAQILENVRGSNYSHHSNVHFFGSDTQLMDLLSVADVVISDYSGAIFDAVLCERPVVLLNSPNALVSEKMDEFCLEFHQRDVLGVQVENPVELYSVVSALLSKPKLQLDKVAHLRKELFVCEYGAVDRIMSALQGLVLGEFHAPKKQLYIRSYMRQAYNYRRGRVKGLWIGVLRRLHRLRRWRW